MSSAHTLSQAEFFRHLELQSVHTVRRMTFYRQALKERLRNTTKQDSLSLPKAKAESTPAVTKAKVTSTNNNNVRRICAKPKVRKEKSSRKLENGFDERRLAALRPIWKVRRGQPKIRKEMEEWVAAKEQSGSKSMIECRIGKSPVENITADRKESYTCRVRIQKGISKKDIEEEKRNRKTVLPGTFPLLPIEDVSFKPRNVDDDEMESGEKQKMPNTSETDKEKTECTNAKRVETPLPQFSCKKCPKKLSDLQSLSDHDKSVHCRTCRMCQRGISSQGFWFGCPDLCRNCATTITKSKLNCGNKILLMVMLNK